MCTHQAPFLAYRLLSIGMCVTNFNVISAWIFHTPMETPTVRRVRARGLPSRTSTPVGRVPSRGVRGCEISGLAPMPFGYSVRGQCHRERRKDRWFCNPKGIVSSSPGLPSPPGYPGLASVRFSTPTGLCPLYAIGPQPRWGWPTPAAFPRVARGSQPWASGRNPFGIQLWNIRKALELAPAACGAAAMPAITPTSSAGRFVLLLPN